VLSHRNLLSSAQAIAGYLGLTAADRGLCLLPTHFAYSNSALNSHLACGARLAIEDSLAAPPSVLQRVQDEAITGLAGVSSTFSEKPGSVGIPIEGVELEILRAGRQAAPMEVGEVRVCGPNPGRDRREAERRQCDAR